MDSIGDMLVRIKNAQDRGSKKTLVPFSRMKKDIAEILVQEKYIKAVTETEEDGKKNLEIALDYSDDFNKIRRVKRVSKLGRRIYKGYRQIFRVMNGTGLAIVSTSRGVMTDTGARKSKVGGEIICELY